MILFTSYDIMATKNVTIMRNEKVTVNAALIQKYLRKLKNIYLLVGIDIKKLT